VGPRFVDGDPHQAGRDLDKELGVVSQIPRGSERFPERGGLVAHAGRF
jgi:hypothetical protein